MWEQKTKGKPKRSICTTYLIAGKILHAVSYFISEGDQVFLRQLQVIVSRSVEYSTAVSMSRSVVSQEISQVTVLRVLDYDVEWAVAGHAAY